MRTMPTIHAVLFDYGLVLSGPADPASWERLKHVFSAEEESFSKSYWAHRHAYDRGDLNSVSYWNALAVDLHRTIDATQLSELVAADTALWSQPNQPMIDWAAALQQSGIKTGILSNLGDAMETGIRDGLPWLGAFHHHTFSNRLGIAKPELAIYVHAAAGLGEPPANILFIDDREENIAASRAAGMLAVQYSTHPAFIAEMNALGLTHLLHPSHTESWQLEAGH